MHVETCYVACNCNQTPTAVHWGSNNLICYAACHAIMIYNPEIKPGGKVVATLVGHKKRVNSVKWISDIELVSGSSDQTAIVWTKQFDSTYKAQLLRGHSSNVNIVDGVIKDSSKKEAVVVTAGMDSSVKIYIREREDFVLRESIDYGYSMCVGLKLGFLPDNSLILACAPDNSKIDLYCEKEGKFCLSATLKGHEDWVRGLDFHKYGDDLILASSSQDLYIRLWRITPYITEEPCDNLLDSGGTQYRIYVDSILTGHEGWIYSVNWSPKAPQLLSTSLDKSMVIWELDPASNLWIEKIRVGEVGGNTLGFYGGLFSPDGQAILAHSYHGAFHIWHNQGGEWESCVTVGGHFGEVTDLAWEPQGEFLMSVSMDQTTRIHAPWPKDNLEVTWHEIARPQVHGYDMSSITMLSRYKFASSSEEKVVRTFEAPRNFVENFARICKISGTNLGSELTPKGASVPSLGLSNKAVFADNNMSEEKNNKKNDLYSEESYFTAVTMTEPPTEETLLQNTLWPEIQKLYGHGYEVYSLASSPDGRFLASACKATSLEHAAILLWDTSSWKQIQKLFSHTLTVAQMSFSPNSRHLLSVSRDRRWSLFSKKSDNSFELTATTDKKTSIHTRIIWTCAWSHDSKYFATGSRDGRVVVWTHNADKRNEGVLGQYEAASKCLELKNESVTALDFAPNFILNHYLIAVGLESGVIQCYSWHLQGWQEVLNFDKSMAHHLAVKKLAFRPILGRAGNRSDNQNILQLASCSCDYSVKIHNLVLIK